MQSVLIAKPYLAIQKGGFENCLILAVQKPELHQRFDGGPLPT